MSFPKLRLYHNLIEITLSFLIIKCNQNLLSQLQLPSLHLNCNLNFLLLLLPSLSQPPTLNKMGPEFLLPASLKDQVFKLRTKNLFNKNQINSKTNTPLSEDLAQVSMEMYSKSSIKLLA